MNQSHITVLGAGYVGLTTAAILAHSGYCVYIVEPNSERLSTIKEGRSFFYEDGLDILIKTAIENKTLTPTASYKESIPHSFAVFSCVGTPNNPDGSTNLQYVFAAAEESLKFINHKTLFIQKSTVPVGTGEKLEILLNTSKKSVEYVSNPEFLRESSAVYDTLYFDRVVAGGNSSDAVKETLKIYQKIKDHRSEIADLASIKKNERTGRFIETDLNSAELIKVSSNAFLAMKISFANSIAKLSDAVGADINEVMSAVGADERIGAAFLNAGRGYGGGCFPKDVSGLIASGLDHNIELDLIQATQLVNSSMPRYVIEKLHRHLDEKINNKKIAVLGLSFKSGTSDTRCSPGILIANLLDAEGAIVTVYDPKANNEAAPELNSGIIIAKSIQEAIQNAAAIIIATNWPEFTNLALEYYKKNTSASVIFDAVNSLDRKTFIDSNITYMGVGR